MITWVMVGLLLAAETTCGRSLVSGNESGTKEETTRQKSGLKAATPDEEDIYREHHLKKTFPIFIIKLHKK